jgi:hypothetical protein
MDHDNAVINAQNGFLTTDDFATVLRLPSSVIRHGVGLSFFFLSPAGDGKACSVPREPAGLPDGKPAARDGCSSYGKMFWINEEDIGLESYCNM